MENNGRTTGSAQNISKIHYASESDLEVHNAGFTISSCKEQEHLIITYGIGMCEMLAAETLK